MRLFDYKCLRCEKAFQSPKKNKKYCTHECYGKRFAPVTLVCYICDKKFEMAYRFRAQKTCSTTCSGVRYSQIQSKPIYKQCNWCDKEYTTVPNAAETSKFCSKECFHLHLRDGSGKFVTLNCEACHVTYEKSYIRRNSRFCSRSCATSGERNAMFGLGKEQGWNKAPRWNNGLTAKTDDRLRLAGEKISVIISQKIVDGEWTHPMGFESGWFESQKCEKSMFYRSSYERRYFEMLEIDTNVSAFQSEPFRLPYLFEGSMKNYVPDVLVTLQNGVQQLVEVKPGALVNDTQNIAKRNAAQAWCHANGVEYVLVTEKDLDAIT